MDIKLTKQQIASLLETLQEQYDNIKHKEGKIPQIEIDILLNNTRSLYEALLHLNKINAGETVIPKPELVIEKEIPEVKKEIIAEPEPKQDRVNIVTDTIKPELKVEESTIKENKPAHVEQKIIEERANTINKSSKPVSKSGNLFEESTVGNKFEDKQTVHDKISKAKEEKSWNEKLQNQPLQDLKKSIGINEKFKFVNELFDGNLKDYNESIDFLNSCKTFSDAEKYINEVLMPKFNWKKESGVYQSLMFLIQRKFHS